MRSYVLLSAITLTTLVACAEQQPDQLPPTQVSSDTPNAARLYYDAYVQPMFAQRCASCHANGTDPNNAPDYLGLDGPERFYDHVVERKDFVSCSTENSLLLNKGFDPGHPGGKLTDDEHQKVQTWLETEANYRFGALCNGEATVPTSTVATGSGGAGGGGVGGAGGAPPVGPLTGTVAMQQFGDCMTLDDWTNSGMPNVANQKCNLANIEYHCYSCHNAPQGMNLMPDPNAGTAEQEISKAFEYMRYMYASFNLVEWTVNDADGSFKDIVKSNRWRDKGVEANQPGSTHPAFTLSDERLAAYDAWFQLTYDKWKAGNCGPGAVGAGALAFGASCTADADCESGLCYAFTVGHYCTVECPNGDGDCPPESSGCNLMGVCKYN